MHWQEWKCVFDVFSCRRGLIHNPPDLVVQIAQQVILYVLRHCELELIGNKYWVTHGHLVQQADWHSRTIDQTKFRESSVG